MTAGVNRPEKYRAEPPGSTSHGWTGPDFAQKPFSRPDTARSAQDGSQARVTPISQLWPLGESCAPSVMSVAAGVLKSCALGRRRGSWALRAANRRPSNCYRHTGASGVAATLGVELDSLG